MERQKPVVFGVAGGTASGKTTFARTILEALGEEHAAYLPHDAYYRDMSHLSYEERVRLNYDHPDSLETDLLVEHVKLLCEGEKIERPLYDFQRHRRSSETVPIVPGRLILVEGILIFTSAPLRELMDIRVFVDIDADIRFIRRLHRDMNERGRSLDSIIRQYLRTVRPMHLEFVEPSKRYADLIIPHGGRNRVATELVISRLREMLGEATSV